MKHLKFQPLYSDLKDAIRSAAVDFLIASPTRLFLVAFLILVLVIIDLTWLTLTQEVFLENNLSSFLSQPMISNVLLL